MQHGANILSVSWQTSLTPCLKQWYYPRFQQANPTQTLLKGRHTKPPCSLQPCRLPTPLQKWSAENPSLHQLMASTCGLDYSETQAQGPKRSGQHSRPWFISDCSIQNYLSPGRKDWAGHVLFPGSHTSAPAPHCSSAQPLLQHKLCCHVLCNYSTRANVSGHLPGQKGENESDQLSCDFMASCTDIHMLLCTVSLITSFQKDRQRNEWVVKHAHKNIIACLRAFVSCLWFTGPPVLHFLIICTFPMKNKRSMCMQFILIFLPPSQDDKTFTAMQEWQHCSHEVHYTVINTC